MISPRSAKTKTVETAVDLTVLALAIAFGFEVARACKVEIPQGLEVKATAFAMALGGTAARWLRHRRVYG